MIRIEPNQEKKRLAREKLREYLTDKPVIELPAGTQLYRGSLETWPDEYPELRILTGTKYFSPCREIALQYSQTDPAKNPTPKTPKNPDDRSVLYSACLLSKARVLVISDFSELFRFIDLPFGDCWWRLEKTELLPLARQLKNDPTISGYVTNSDLACTPEVFLDLHNTYLSQVTVEYLTERND